MKKYRFRFGSVLRIRQLEEEQARAAMVEAQRELDAATGALHARLEAVSVATSPGRTWVSADFQEDRTHLTRHADAVAAARSAEANALAVFRTSRTAWEDAASRVRALERLDERQREDWVLDTTRNAQQLTDEIATTRFRPEDR